MNIHRIVASLLASCSLLGVSSLAQSAPEAGPRSETRGPGRPRLEFSDLDVNRDGNISEEEFNKVRSERRQNRPQGERPRRAAAESAVGSEAAAVPAGPAEGAGRGEVTRKPLPRENAGEGPGPQVRERRREGPGVGGPRNEPRRERGMGREEGRRSEGGPRAEFGRGPRADRRGDGDRGPRQDGFRRGPGPMHGDAPRHGLRHDDRPHRGMAEGPRRMGKRVDARDGDTAPRHERKGRGHGHGPVREMERPDDRG